MCADVGAWAFIHVGFSWVNDGFGEVDEREVLRRRKRRDRLRAARNRGTHTDAEWRSLLAEFGGRCVRCGREGLRLVKDHIVPIYRGGSDAIGNLQPMCDACNCSKGPEQVNWKEYRFEHGF